LGILSISPLFGLFGSPSRLDVELDSTIKMRLSHVIGSKEVFIVRDIDDVSLVILVGDLELKVGLFLEDLSFDDGSKVLVVGRGVFDSSSYAISRGKLDSQSSGLTNNLVKVHRI
jgi:hypothetical protein